MIALLVGAFSMALFVALVMLFGTRPRRPSRWPDAVPAGAPGIEIFREMLWRAEIAAKQQAAAAAAQTTRSPE